MCSNNQPGVDIVIPICHITISLAQVCDGHFSPGEERGQVPVNDRRVVVRPNGPGPDRVGLFPDTDKLKVAPKPVIRIVFALAALEAGVRFPEARRRDHHYPDKFTAFDVWCAGSGDKAFKHIDGDLASYQLLLERLLRPHDAFDLQDDREGPEHDETR
jgi:hypothetical protein